MSTETWVHTTHLSERQWRGNPCIWLGVAGPNGGSALNQPLGIETARKLAYDLLAAVREHDARIGYTAPALVEAKLRGDPT